MKHVIKKIKNTCPRQGEAKFAVIAAIYADDGTELERQSFYSHDELHGFEELMNDAECYVSLFEWKWGEA